MKKPNNTAKYDDNTVYILCECAMNPEDIWMDVLQESYITQSDGTKIPVVTIDTCLQSFEVLNWNERIYGADVVMEAIDNDGMIQNDIKHGQWIGEYGHPLDCTPRRQMIFYPPTCSHRILNYRREGNLLKGHVQTLSDGMGTMMANRILQGVPAAFSLRSLGAVDPTTRRVKKPLKVITYDSVYRPSHIEAYQEKILSEASTYIPTKYSMKDIMTESAMCVPISETIDEIVNYTKAHSDNVKIIADMFNLDKIECVLSEDASSCILTIDKDTKAVIPIESFINMQYNSILNTKIK